MGRVDLALPFLTGLLAPALGVVLAFHLQIVQFSLRCIDRRLIDRLGLLLLTKVLFLGLDLLIQLFVGIAALAAAAVGAVKTHCAPVLA